MSTSGIVSECFYPLHFGIVCMLFFCYHCIITMIPSGGRLNWRCVFLHAMALCKQ